MRRCSGVNPSAYANFVVSPAIGNFFFSPYEMLPYSWPEEPWLQGYTFDTTPGKKTFD